MLPEQMPRCVCGTKVYNSGGGNFGPDRTSQWFSCGHCTRSALMISQSGVAIALYPTEGTASKFPDEGIDWVNSTLSIWLADVGDRLKKAKELWEEHYIWMPVCDKLGIPHGSTVTAKYDTEKKANDYWLKDAEGNKIEDSESLVTPFRDTWKELESRSPGFVCQELPPQVPELLTVRVGFYIAGLGEACAWSPPVSHEQTKDLPIPEDPRRRCHDEVFQGVWKELRDKGYAFPVPTEIPNEYFNDSNNVEPWFTFKRGKETFTVGPRKRVISIHIKAPKFSARGLISIVNALGKRDDTTHETGPTSVLIHAWGRDKLVEYLTALMA
jgi:hypothetical protein